MKKLQSWGVTSVGVCYMLVGLQICREVIFQVIKRDFQTSIIGISLAITQVLCISIYALLTKRERSSSPPGRFQTMICSKVSDQRNSKHAVHFKSANQCFGPVQRL